TIFSRYWVCKRAIAYPSALCADHGAIALEHAHLATFDHFEPDAIAFAGCRVEQHHVGNIDRHRLVDDAAGDTLHRIRPHVLFDHVDAFHRQVLLIDAGEHHASLALVAARDHHHLVALANPFHDQGLLQHFRRERHDLHERLGTQLARDGSEDARADRLELV